MRTASSPTSAEVGERVEDFRVTRARTLGDPNTWRCRRWGRNTPAGEHRARGGIVACIIVAGSPLVLQQFDAYIRHVDPGAAMS